MDLTELLQDWWRKLDKYDPLGHKIGEAVAKQDSKTARSIGKATGWKWLEEQGDKNVKDPTRALAHGAQGAAAYFAYPYLAAMGGGGEAGGAAAGGGVAAAGGMFGAEAAPGLIAATQEQLMQQAIQQAAIQQAEEAALATASSAAPTAASSLPAAGQGMFSQIPGVTSGSPQAQMLMEQTGMFGGQGADMTAQSAMPAVRDAYSAGRMGTMDYMGNVAKADMAGMNDPSVWLDRLGRNAGRLAGNSGKYMAANALTSRPAPAGSAPPPRVQSQPMRTDYGKEGPADMEQLKADLKAGRITIDEFLMRMGAA